ncbi:unnamed protein product, partial [Allacma fusca]
VQMLEQERQRVRELQKRIQDAVREEWEASKKSRNNQCQSLNSVGSDDSTQTISDTPTDRWVLFLFLTTLSDSPFLKS